MKRVIIFLLIGIFLISLTSAANSTCDNIYYFILETNYNYNEVDLINESFTQDDINNYSELCPDSDSLPEKPENETDIIYKKELPICDINTNTIFSSIEFQLSPKNECKKVNFWRHIFSIDDSYKITGVRFFPFVILIFIVFIISFLKSGGLMNRLIIQKLKEEKFK